MVMLNNSASKLLHDFHLESGKLDKNEEKLRVIRTAARLILSDITSLNIDSDWYPDSSTLGDVKKQINCLHDSLICFLRILICGKKKNTKTASLRQAIAQASRPRKPLFPVRFGIAVHAHPAFGSRRLVEILSKLGFCSSNNKAKNSRVAL